eukprot:TRINITY_DN28657_c0_g1_i1.p1 TRINITY_DN28657_c0_g1~~TRINITY_DN28657_c0_g1_i1.p1  ORF type:complete len:177 (-),score=40.14 TRINITY_DN28657_c0_g1_i1:62-592(-)
MLQQLKQKNNFNFTSKRENEIIKEIQQNLKQIYPNFLRQFINLQLNKWIQNAIIAQYYFQENANYIVDNDEIKPVDYENTGQIQSSTSWGDGLHQFLQIKHNLKITPESLITNYISNIAFFKRYESNLIGFTGTLGSKNSIEILERTYNLECLIVPQEKQKQFVEYTPKIVQNKQK